MVWWFKKNICHHISYGFIWYMWNTHPIPWISKPFPQKNGFRRGTASAFPKKAAMCSGQRRCWSGWFSCSSEAASLSRGKKNTRKMNFNGFQWMNHVFSDLRMHERTWREKFLLCIFVLLRQHTLIRWSNKHQLLFGRFWFLQYIISRLLHPT